MQGCAKIGLAILACVLAACGAAGFETPAVTIAPAPVDIRPPSAALNFLPTEVALPTVQSDTAGAHRVAGEFEDEPEEVITLSADQLAYLSPLDGDLRVRPLAELASGIATLLARSGGSVTAAVVVPSRNTIYVANPELALPMASVVKLVIMLALLDRAESEGRVVTAEEIALLDPMVTWSDNDSASLLWDELGGGPGIEAYLERAGMGGVLPDSWAWGDTRASGTAVALLLARLAFYGDLVNDEHRALALNLLSHVSEDQRWGVGGSLIGPTGAVVAVKDGWYQVPRGWRAGSAGVLAPPRDAHSVVTGYTPYSIAVLTAENKSLEGGVATIQGIASLVHAALSPAFVAARP